MRQRNDKVLMISYLMNPGKGSKSRIPSKFAIDCQPLSGMFTIHNTRWLKESSNPYKFSELE